VPTSDDLALLELVPHRREDGGPLDGEALDAGVSFLLQSEAARQGATLRLVMTPGDRATLARLVEHADRLLVRRGEGSRHDGVPTTHTRGAAASYRAEFVQRDFSGPGA